MGGYAPFSAIGLLIISTISILFYGCVEKEGYYGENGNTIIVNLTNKEWSRKYRPDESGHYVEVKYIFKDNGSGIWKERVTDRNGKVEENILYFHWSFTTPNFKYIYLDLECYWEISKLTATQLCIYETWDDPLVVTGQHYRDYQEYTYNAGDEDVSSLIRQR